MNFEEAIKAHSEWKIRLRGYLNKPDKSLDPAAVAADDRCELGKWLKAGGAGKDGAAATLRRDHAAFHAAAAEIIRKANAGIAVTEEVAIGSGTEFAKASMAVVAQLMELKKKAK